MILTTDNKNHNKIINIISDINSHDKSNAIHNLFIDGYCYDFAFILWRNIPESEIVFFPKRKHYMLKHGNRFYDITGEVKIDSSEKYEIDNPLDFLKTR